MHIESPEEVEMRFKFSGSFEIDTSEEPWRNEGLRVGFFANSGAGKSYTCGILTEQWMDQGGTVVIFEPRAEWHTLKQKYPIQVVGGPFNQDVPLVDSEPNLYAEVVVKQGVSLVIYTGDIEDEEKLVEFVMRFINRLLRLQEEYHRPILLVLEESQEYCPISAKGRIAAPWIYNRMIKAFKDCFSQGRKLNVCPVAISQRPQEVNFTIRQLCKLVWFGGFSAQDAKYLDTEVFAPYRKQGIEISAQDLIGASTGEWIVIAGRTTARVRVTEKRKTPHGADTPTLDFVQPVGEEIQRAVSELGEQLKAMLEKRAAEQSELEKAKAKNRTLTEELEKAQSRLNLVSDLRSLFQGQTGIDDSEMKRRIVEMEEKHQKEIEDRESTIKSLQTQLRELESLKEENQALMEQTAKYGALEDFFRDIIQPLIPQAQAVSLSEKEIEAIVEHKIQKLSAPQRARIAVGETGIPWVNIWLDKLKPMEQKILRYLAEKFPLTLSKSEIALGTGYSVGGGSFNQALANLSRWHLVKKEGDRYKLSEGPPG